MSTKTHTGIPDEQTRRKKERERNMNTARPAALKTRRGFSYTIAAKKVLLLTVLLHFEQYKMKHR
jgi:hypothetical protein